MAVDNGIIVDKIEGRFEITSASTYPSADVSQTVDGVFKIEIDTGSGFSTFYDNTDYNNPNYTTDIDGAGVVQPIVNAIYKALPISNGVMTKGLYKFTFSDQYLISSTPTVITQSIEFNYEKDVDVKPCLSKLISCATPEIRVEDKSDYVFEEVTPTFETSTLVLEYPETSGQYDLTVIAVPFLLTTNNVWTKSYQATSTVIALYQFTAYQERIKSQGELSFNVDCSSLCNIYDCISALYNEMKYAKGQNNGKYKKLSETYVKAMSIASQINIAQSCGKSDDIPQLVEDVKNIINMSDCTIACGSTCTDSVSKKVRGSYGDPFSLQNAYIGVGGANPITSADVLALTETLIINDGFSLHTGNTETKFKICLPPGRSLVSVIDIDAFNVDIVSQYVLQGTVPVVIDSIAYNFNIYVMDTSVPYTTSHEHVVLTTI